ncbi:hypothetical protein G6F57_017113 [Rhizopus arrhizus]|nr:hypothetical protein G6F57_017113 [Rhizopus arrhizus]
MGGALHDWHRRVGHPVPTAVWQAARAQCAAQGNVVFLASLAHDDDRSDANGRRRPVRDEPGDDGADDDPDDAPHLGRSAGLHLWSAQCQFVRCSDCNFLMSRNCHIEDTKMMKDTEATAEREIPPDNSTLYVGLGLGLGSYVTATSVLAGFVCPVCVVAAPALLATGVYQKIRNRSRRPENRSEIQIKAR